MKISVDWLVPGKKCGTAMFLGWECHGSPAGAGCIRMRGSRMIMAMFQSPRREYKLWVLCARTHTCGEKL